MEKFIYYNNLLEIYEEMLTEKNAVIFSYYYRENLSMQEIADIMQVSKSYVGTSIKKTEKKLDFFEEKLHLYSIEETLNDCLEEMDINKIKKKIINILEN